MGRWLAVTDEPCQHIQRGLRRPRRLAWRPFVLEKSPARVYRRPHALVQEVGNALPAGCCLDPPFQRAAVAAAVAANLLVQEPVHLILAPVGEIVGVKPDEKPVARLHALAHVAFGVPAKAPQAILAASKFPPGLE